MDHPNKVNRHFFLWLLAHISVSHLQHLLFSSDQCRVTLQTSAQGQSFGPRDAHRYWERKRIKDWSGLHTMNRTALSDTQKKYTKYCVCVCVCIMCSPT